MAGSNEVALRAINKAAAVSTSHEVDRFVESVRRRNPSMSPVELINALSKSYTGLVATTGGAAGGVTAAAANGLSARSIRKYHTLLHSIFARAVRDQLLLTNSCAHTDLPKVIAKKTQAVTPEEYGVLIAAIPDAHRLMVETAIETGMRWGELIALKPRHADFLRRTLTVQDTIMEVSRKHSPTGQRYVPKPYPQDNEARTFAVRQDWLDAVAKHIKTQGIGRDDLLFTTKAGTPISRNTFRTRIWQPAVTASGIDFNIRIHDLRHADATWLLAGGSDLKSVMDRLGHAHIQPTQKSLHTLPEADHLDALDKMTRGRPEPPH